MTVGPGITPGLLTLPPTTAEAASSPSARGLCALRAITAGGELHPALRTFLPPKCLAAQRFYHIFAVCAWPLLDDCYRVFRSISEHYPSPRVD